MVRNDNAIGAPPRAPTRSLSDEQTIAQTVRQLLYSPDFFRGDLRWIAETKKFDRGSLPGRVQNRVTGSAVTIPGLSHRTWIDDELHLSVLTVKGKRTREFVSVLEIEQGLRADPTRHVEFTGKDPGDVGMADEGMRTGHRKKCRDKLGWLLHVISEEVFGQGLFRRGVNQQVITVVIQEGVGLHEVEKRLPSGRHRWVVVVSSRFELRSCPVGPLGRDGIEVRRLQQTGEVVIAQK